MNQHKFASLILCLILPLGCTLDLSDYPEVATDVGLNSSDESEPANPQNDSSVADVYLNNRDMTDVSNDASVETGSGHSGDSGLDDIDADPSDAGSIDGSEQDANDPQVGDEESDGGTTDPTPDACSLVELPIADVQRVNTNDRGILLYDVCITGTAGLRYQAFRIEVNQPLEETQLFSFSQEYGFNEPCPASPAAGFERDQWAYDGGKLTEDVIIWRNDVNLASEDDCQYDLVLGFTTSSVLVLDSVYLAPRIESCGDCVSEESCGTPDCDGCDQFCLEQCRTTEPNDCCPTDERDCAGVCNGTATQDNCGICDAEPANDNSTCCGDGTVQAHEACDDGNDDETDECLSSCILASCGDGFIQVGVEECDDGNTQSEQCLYGETQCMVCAADCTEQSGGTSFCGDNEVNGAEGCDDGNTVTEACEYSLQSCTICAANCTEQPGDTSFCGDGIRDEEHESCDDGTDNGNDACPYGEVSCEVCNGACQITNGQPRVCGDGIRDEGHESCDDGNAIDNDGCSADCVSDTCGDEVVDEGEDCDDGNTTTETCVYGESSCVVCASNCTEQSGDTLLCGDGVPQADEQCDDGNDDDTDVCLSTCLEATCGDGFVQAGVEACDDGNGDDTDGCLSTCLEASCGDGLYRQASRSVMMAMTTTPMAVYLPA